LFIGLALLLFLSGFVLAEPASSSTDFEWYNSTWHHRAGFNITADAALTDWPVERSINFTDLLASQNNSGTFDEDSIRVIEYDSNGNVKYEVPYQFDKAGGFNNSTNAAGEIIFKVNGSTTGAESRYYFIYFDSTTHGNKQAVSYQQDYSYGYQSGVFEVNTTRYNITVDTDRANDTSGITDVYDQSIDQNIVEASSGDRAAEYIEYSNSTQNFTFDLRNNASFESGPLRLTVTQQGPAAFYEGGSNALFLMKEYRFYERAGKPGVSFVKIRQQITNTGSSSIDLRSPPAGALALDIDRTITNGVDPATLIGNETDPASWQLVQNDGTFIYGGIVNVEESLPGYTAVASTQGRYRLGINLSEYTISPSESIEETAFVSFGRETSRFRDIKDIFLKPPSIDPFGAETYTADIEGSTNATTVNRNETIRLFGNATSPYPNITAYVNATLDMNTTDTGDDTRFSLTQVSDSLWSYNYTLAGDATTGRWTSNVTSFTADRIRLAFNASSFRVSDTYFANLTLNDTVAVETAENLYGNISLTNVRNDTMITGANISCDYGDGPFYPSNEIEPGLYSLNVTAPSPPDNYVLTCNGTRDGNLGQDTAAFTTEVAKVGPNISFIPSETTVDDITQANASNRTFTVNVTNFADGTASNTNITLDPPQNPVTWTLNTTSVNCGDLTPDSFCSSAVELEVPNATAPANYSVNTTAEWKNPDGTVNDTEARFNVTVETNPVVALAEQLVNGSVGGGQFKVVDNVTARSIGNTNLTNLNLSCDQGTVCTEFDVDIEPPDATNIDVNQNLSSFVNVSVPKRYAPGDYTGTINASADGTFDTVPIDITVIGTTSLTGNLNTSQVTADTITQRDGQTFTFQSNATNDGEAFAFLANKTLDLPLSRWNTSSRKEECGDIDVNETCSRSFSFTVANSTDPTDGSLESVLVQTNWTNPDGTFDTITRSLFVEVLSNPVQLVTEAFVNGTVEAGTEQAVGNVTVESQGNDGLENVTYRCINGSGPVCDAPEFSTSFEPTNISSIDDGTNKTVSINVSVGLGYPAGSYGGTVTFNSTGGQDNVTLNITVPETRSWSLELLSDQASGDQNRCITSSDTITGSVCEARVNNTGNVPINVSVDLSSLDTGGNVTTPTTRNISLDLEGTERFNFTYNVSEDRQKTYNDSYNISTDKEAIPDWRNLTITILPSVPPNITVFTQPSVITQEGTVGLLANVTSATGFNISGAAVNVTVPAGGSYNASMTSVKNYTNTTLWRLYYPNATQLDSTDANTTFRGNYTFNISASDTLGNKGYNASNFTVFADLQSTIGTGQERNLGTNTYLPEDFDNVFFTLEDARGAGLQGAKVNVTLAKQDGTVSRRIPEQDSTFTTGDDGALTSTPTFELTSYPSFGVYDIRADADWVDPLTGQSMNTTANTTIVIERESTLEMDWDAGTAWYPESNFTVHTVVEEDGRLTDPTTINLTVFDTDGNRLDGFSFNKSDYERKEEGVYRLRSQLPADAELETYWVRQEVERGPLRTVRFQSFRMVTQEAATQSLFDINASLLKDTVQRGEDLGFNISLLRKTGQSGDSKVTYWISKDGTEYAFISETIFTPVNTTVTIPRDLPIYEGQSEGRYYLNARVSPLESDQSFFANASFRVEQQTDDQTSGGGTNTREETVQRELPGDEEDEDRPQTGFEIVDAPTAINVVRDQTTRRALSVGNTGETTINNVGLVIVGIPPSWYSIEPGEVPEISPANLTTFVVDITPPEDAELGDYNSTFLVTSSNRSIERDFDVTVFASVQERITADLDQIDQRLNELQDRVNRLEERGVNVDAVRRIIAEIEARRDEARQAANRSEYEDAVSAISAANSRSNEAERTLNQLEQSYSERIQVFEILPLLIGVLVLLATILGLAYLVRVRHVNPVDVVEDRLHSVRVEMQRRRQNEEEELREEKQKALELLELLDAQHEEGIIDEKTYNELYSSAEEKLSRINDKLEE